LERNLNRFLKKVDMPIKVKLFKRWLIRGFKIGGESILLGKLITFLTALTVLTHHPLRSLVFIKAFVVALRDALEARKRFLEE
jgi:hypothetical protein